MAYAKGTAFRLTHIYSAAFARSNDDAEGDARLRFPSRVLFRASIAYRLFFYRPFSYIARRLRRFIIVYFLPDTYLLMLL